MRYKKYTLEEDRISLSWFLNSLIDCHALINKKKYRKVKSGVFISGCIFLIPENHPIFNIDVLVRSIPSYATEINKGSRLSNLQRYIKYTIDAL